MKIEIKRCINGYSVSLSNSELSWVCDTLPQALDYAGRIFDEQEKNEARAHSKEII